MTWLAWVALTVWVIAAVAWVTSPWWAYRQPRRRGTQLPPPDERPDYRNLAAAIRVCPECGQSYATRSVVRAEASCNACVERRFTASVEADKREWIDKGWKEKG